MLEHHSVIIVGAGPGGLAVAAALADRKVPDVFVIDRGEIGQVWLEYPSETHLLSASFEGHDDNMIADLPTSLVFPHVPHPSHELYQKYLEFVAKEKKLTVQKNQKVIKVLFDKDEKHFIVECQNDNFYTCDYLVWAAGMYSTPNESFDCEGCYIHYAKMPYLESVSAPEVTVVGSANGASGVVMQLARPGRIVTLISSHKYEVPEPIDCLWKEQMQFVKDLEKQGLVKIVEEFRVSRIYKENQKYVLEDEKGQKVFSTTRPIVCTGFSPNIEPVKLLVDQNIEKHECMLVMDQKHQSVKQPNLYFAGTIGKLSHDQGFILQFREFGREIADDISQKVSK